MTILYLLCGLPGSGKSTRAAELEREHDAIVFSEDAWVTVLYGADNARDNDKRDRIKEIQLALAMSLLSRGIDVVFDWGVWSRSERDFYRNVLAPIGATVQLIYLDVSIEELHRRIAVRNKNLPPDTFHIEPAELDQWATWFEPPDADELAIQ
jgi:predicted kinase